MLAGEHDRAFGPEELPVLGRPRSDARQPPCPNRSHALRKRREAPGNGDALFEETRLSGMERFDGVDAHAQPLLVAQGGKGLRVFGSGPSAAISGNENTRG